MTKITTTLDTANQLNINRDDSIIFLWDNRYEPFTHTNITGAEETILAGTVMGRIAATGLLLPLVAAAIDGSQIPIGISTEDITLAIGASAVMSICVAGDVAEEKLIFNAAETVATLSDGRRLDDRIGADTVGIKLVPSTDLSKYDN